MKAFVIDFDGTITREDVGFSIVKQFAKEGWHEIGQLWLEKKLGTAECGQRQWDLIENNEEDLKKFAKNFKINPGFKELVDKISEKKYKMIIASDGYGVYINEILNVNGFSHIDILCNRAVYDNGWKLSFLNLDQECTLCGNCKKKIVEDLKNKNYEVYYIGDGYSDRCACIYADVIIAKSYLKQYCEEQKIPHFSFDTFFDVLQYI